MCKGIIFYSDIMNNFLVRWGVDASSLNVPFLFPLLYVNSVNLLIQMLTATHVGCILQTSLFLVADPNIFGPSRGISWSNTDLEKKMIYD